MKMQTVTKATMALALGFMANGAVAQTAGVTYDCVVRGHPGHGFVAPRLLLSVSQDQTEGVALDAVINEINGKPLAVPLRALGKGKVLFRYTLRDLPARGTGGINATYTVNLDTRRNRVTMNVQVHGYENEPSGTGRCKLLEG